MEECSLQCIHRTFYAVMIGVSPILICLLFIGLARLILYRLEIAYYRRQKVGDRRTSLAAYQSGRLALSYTPISHAELQRVIQGEYQTRIPHDSSTNNTSARKAPRFIKSLLPRREQAVPPTSILANLVLRRDVIDGHPLTGVLTPMESPLQPTFSVINEQEKRRPSVITIRRESIETTTLSAMNNNNNNNNNNNDNNNNNGNVLTTNDVGESEQISNDPLMAATKTMTTTTVVVEEFLEFHSVSSLPCALTLLTTVSENDNDINLEINSDYDEP